MDSLRPVFLKSGQQIRVTGEEVVLTAHLERLSCRDVGDGFGLRY